MDLEMKAYLDEQFARIDERFVKMDERFERIDERFERIDERFERVDERFVGIDKRFERLEEDVHLTRILVEDVRSDVRLVAEGVMGVSERLEAHRLEMNKGFEDVKASIAPPYRHMDNRVQLLEARAERQTRDILEVIREKFGTPKAES